MHLDYGTLRRALAVIAAIALIVAFSFQKERSLAAQTRAATTPPEHGLITWQRDFDQATRLAKERNRPLMVLFQEVPG